MDGLRFSPSPLDSMTYPYGHDIWLTVTEGKWTLTHATEPIASGTFRSQRGLKLALAKIKRTVMDYLKYLEQVDLTDTNNNNTQQK